MKFTCNARELNTACNNVMRAVSTKMTVPTIEGILMECGSDTLSLTGYDFEFGINTTLQASVTEPGAIVINAKVLCNIIKELTAETVTFDISGTSVSGGQRQRIVLARRCLQWQTAKPLSRCTQGLNLK